MSGFADVHDYCLSLLEAGDLEAKLVAPRAPDGGPLREGLARSAHAPLRIDRPARDAALRMASGADRLPRPRELEDPAARAACLRRFAHHELMAVELFAWALVTWPDAPAGLRRGWLDTLVDEQRHLALYLERLRAHGQDLGDAPLSDYFWKHVPTIRRSEEGPLAFLCAMGLTLEQANLDFTLLYRDAFRAAGDEPSADAAQIVHDDEQRHVRLAVTWLRRLKDPDHSDVQAYEAGSPFPFTAARAKGRGFRAEPRRTAGLDDDFIEYVRNARFRPESGPRALRDAPLLLPNLGAEEGDGWRRMLKQAPVRAAARDWSALFASGARFVGVDALAVPPLPEAQAAQACEPAFPFLRGDAAIPRLFAWWVDADAAAFAERRGATLVGPAPEIVRHVHDKAFALAFARRAGLEPEPLRGCARWLDPDDLSREASALDALQDALATWPAALREAFVLKPRLGSSGRGHVRGSGARVDTPEIRAALARFALGGGLVLEPWLARGTDLSAQFQVHEDGTIEPLGTLEQRLTRAGVPGGHVGRIAADGRVTSGTEHDAAFAPAAYAVVEAARDAGYTGACGVDAFSFDLDGRSWLRPVVEFNARFTLGTVALGLLARRRRAEPEARPRVFRYRVGEPLRLEG